MRSKTSTRFTAIALLAVLVVPSQLGGRQHQAASPATPTEGEFVLTSTTFANGARLPLSMIFSAVGCAAGGATGGDQSPQMSWTAAKPGTQSFVVMLYDVTAAFTHWGMYNIPAGATGLPENAGVAGSTYGQQIANDLTFDEEYDGPCPPSNGIPVTHEYVLTVYALDEQIKLAGSPDFPPFGEALFRALLAAARGGHVLQSSSITGFYSSRIVQ
jgi:Raf kinase inhibitor-like YbhB/YbcL family protein